MAKLGVLGESKFSSSGTSDTPAGTKVLFMQTAAPTGWTKDVTHNEKTLRVVSGTASNGGTQSFSTVFGTGSSTASHTLTTPQMPSHSHTYRRATNMARRPQSDPTNATGAGPTTNTQNAGGSGGHSHSLNLDIQYVDVIVAAKD